MIIHAGQQLAAVTQNHLEINTSFDEGSKTERDQEEDYKQELQYYICEMWELGKKKKKKKK